MSDDNGLLYLGAIVVVGASSLFSRTGQAVPSIEDIQLSIPDGMMPDQDDTVPSDNPDVGDDGVYDTDPGSGPDPDLSTSGGGTDTSPGSADADETLNVIDGGSGNTGEGSADETLPVVDTSGTTTTSHDDGSFTVSTSGSSVSSVDDDSGVSDSSPKGYGTETIEESQEADSWVENAKDDGGANFL